jgi:hypothetical protein
MCVFLVGLRKVLCSISKESTTRPFKYSILELSYHAMIYIKSSCKRVVKYFESQVNIKNI